jgi:hypothetical protein
MKRKLRRWLGPPTGALLFYAALALNPSLLMAHELRVENVVLHSRHPLPPEAQAILRQARARVSQSLFFDPAEEYDLYLCDTPSLFAFYVPWAPRVGAVSLVGVTGNIFLRPVNVLNDRLIGPDGKEVPGVRSLTYYLAHELTHTAMGRKLGRVAYFRLGTWVQEGYADLIGKAGAFDFEAERQRLRDHDAELDPARSGLYLRYQLYVEALLREGMPLEALSQADLDQLERRLRQESY